MSQNTLNPLMFVKGTGRSRSPEWNPFAADWVVRTKSEEAGVGRICPSSESSSAGCTGLTGDSPSRPVSSPHGATVHLDERTGQREADAQPSIRAVARVPANTDSIDNVDPSAVSGRLGERTVAGDHWRLNRFGEGHVHGVVCADVVSQFPRTTQQIKVGVTVEIEVGEIGNRFVGTAGGDLTGPHETPEALNDLHVHEVRRMELVFVAKETGLDSTAKGSLQQKLQHGRRVDDDHADSRSSRMTTAAGVLRVTRFR